MAPDGNDLERYANDLQQALILEAEVEGAEQMRSEVFTRHLIEVLMEAGEVEEATSCHLHTRGVEVHGYGVDDGDTLNLIGTIHRGDVPPSSVTRTEVATAFRRLHAFWERCRDRPFHEQLEDSADAYDMALHVHQVREHIRRVRLFVVTDGVSSAERLEVQDIDGIEVRRGLWDVERLHRLDTSGQPREPIEIDFVARYGEALPCLGAAGGREDYEAMLAVFPGEWLADVYHEFGARLLELNVRSFLQATGKVNRGIRDTLREEPQRFLAYNNGIAATAAEVSLVDLPDGGRGIARLRDLQIVNGGQTTASIHRARVAGIGLSEVAVQAKVTVVPPDKLEEIVPLISRFANSQNKVSEADLRANDPFHVEIESLSRTVWSPAAGDALRQTRWFYERARGQYRDAVSREGTPARQRAWKETHPTGQRFTKTDLAKYENAWAQLPHEVSRGAQKNFTLFMAQLAQRQVSVDVSYFQRLVAKAILWRRTERLVTQQAYGGYRANLVAFSIAKLSHATAQRLDLTAIWERQDIGPGAESALADLSRLAWKVLVDDAPAGANITEWAKRDGCWKAMRAERWELPIALGSELVAVGRGGGDRPATEPSAAEDPAVAECQALGADGWLSLANWAKQTANLAPWQRKLSFDIGTRMMRGRPPSSKQAAQGKRILDEAVRLGFVV